MCSQWRSQPDMWSCKCKFFCVYRPYKESVSKEMNNDNNLNLHLHDQIVGLASLLCTQVKIMFVVLNSQFVSTPSKLKNIPDHC